MGRAQRCPSSQGCIGHSKRRRRLAANARNRSGTPPRDRRLAVGVSALRAMPAREAEHDSAISATPRQDNGNGRSPSAQAAPSAPLSSLKAHRLQNPDLARAVRSERPTARSIPWRHSDIFVTVPAANRPSRRLPADRPHGAPRPAADAPASARAAILERARPDPYPPFRAPLNAVLRASQAGSLPHHAPLGSGGWPILTGPGLPPGGPRQGVSDLLIRSLSSSPSRLCLAQRNAGPRPDAHRA